MRPALGLAAANGADTRNRRTAPTKACSMTPTAVSTPPASRSRQRARPARAKDIRPTTANSAPVRIHLRIRLTRVNDGDPDLPTELADWLHTTMLRRCDRSLI